MNDLKVQVSVRATGPDVPECVWEFTLNWPARRPLPSVGENLWLGGSDPIGVLRVDHHFDRSAPAEVILSGDMYSARTDWAAWLVEIQHELRRDFPGFLEKATMQRDGDLQAFDAEAVTERMEATGASGSPVATQDVVDAVRSVREGGQPVGDGDLVAPVGLCEHGFHVGGRRDCYDEATRVVRYTSAVGSRATDTQLCDTHADRALGSARHTDVTRHPRSEDT